MNRLLLLLFLLLPAGGCIEDYDVQEVAPDEHLETETADHHHHHEEDHHGDEVHTGSEGAPSDHAHGAGERNHGTGWFFNQPWAASFIWGKLLRDGLIFLGLAVIVFLATGRRARRK